VGSYRIERTFPSPVGKIVRATGTKDERLFRRILEAIDFVGDRLGIGPLWVSILLRVKDGSYSPKDMMYEMNAWIDSPSDYKPKTIKRVWYRNYQISCVRTREGVRGKVPIGNSP
jgi:hypothetical protein